MWGRTARRTSASTISVRSASSSGGAVPFPPTLTRPTAAFGPRPRWRATWSWRWAEASFASSSAKTARRCSRGSTPSVRGRSCGPARARRPCCSRRGRSGSAVEAADVLASEGIEVEVGIVATPLEIDDAALRYVAEAPLVITVEDHNARTGLGATVAEWLAENGGEARLVRLGRDGVPVVGRLGGPLRSRGAGCPGHRRGGPARAARLDS